MNPALPGNDRGKWASALLAVLVHVMLGLFLFYGVRWQNRLPDPVEVELVSPPPPAAAQLAPPPPPAPPAPARPAPPPPRPEPDDEPEPPPRKQPDIAIKDEKTKEKPEPKEPKKEEPKPEPPKPEPQKPAVKPSPNGKVDATELSGLSKTGASTMAFAVAAVLLLAAVVFPDWLGRLAGLAFALANGGLAWVLFRAVGRYRQAWLDMTLKLAIKKK